MVNLLHRTGIWQIKNRGIKETKTKTDMLCRNGTDVIVCGRKSRLWWEGFVERTGSLTVLNVTCLLFLSHLQFYLCIVVDASHTNNQCLL